MMPSPPIKKKQTSFTNDSILESLRDLGSGVGKTVARDVAGKVATDAFSSLFGKPSTHDLTVGALDTSRGKLPNKAGELKMNQAVEFGREKPPVFPFARPEMRPRAPYVRLEENDLKQKIEVVRQELKALSVSIKSLNLEINKAVSDVPVQPGIYHLNFLERLRSVLKMLRENIEDSRSWLSLWNNRKKKKNYWGLYKKHGTSFGLSSERTLATQAG